MYLALLDKFTSGWQCKLIFYTSSYILNTLKKFAILNLSHDESFNKTIINSFVTYFMYMNFAIAR